MGLSQVLPDGAMMPSAANCGNINTENSKAQIHGKGKVTFTGESPNNHMEHGEDVIDINPRRKKSGSKDLKARRKSKKSGSRNRISSSVSSTASLAVSDYVRGHRSHSGGGSLEKHTESLTKKGTKCAANAPETHSTSSEDIISSSLNTDEGGSESDSKLFARSTQALRDQAEDLGIYR